MHKSLSPNPQQISTTYNTGVEVGAVCGCGSMMIREKLTPTTQMMM
jgi:hypothetical protein